MSVDVDAIKARLEAGRDLPWSWRVTDDRRWAVVEDANGDRRAQVNDDDVAEFIAHAPADIAALLAERDALAQRLARVEALRDSWLVEAAHDECRCGWCDGCTARAMALDLRAALGDEDA